MQYDLSPPAPVTMPPVMMDYSPSNCKPKLFLRMFLLGHSNVKSNYGRGLRDFYAWPAISKALQR
ncbi:hypothetical protein I79_001776 [Cricetulus griseus]|uniref:Uncharacterized protein n=1 Tax=Cricetulus griseus TaxID=10029 RepID=G3GVN3_CRIGR|nr:hypothetical protein I79_001776 [Cricetulus griseus]